LCHKLSKKDRSDTAQTISRAPSILATHVTIVPRTRMHRDRHVHRNVHTSIQRGCRMGEDRLQCHREGPGAVHAFALGHFHFKYPLPSETPYLKALVYKYLPT
jgi:hypothetical protein